MNLKFWQKRKDPPLALKKIYTDKEGNNYFTWKDPTEIPIHRANMAQMFSRYADLLLTKSLLSTLVDKALEECDNGKLTKVAVLLNEIKIREDLYAEPETLLQLATCYVMLKGESPHEYNQHEAQKKLNLWDSDHEAKSFFLQFAYQCTTSYSENSDKSILDYLKEMDPVISRMPKILSSLSNT